MDHMDVDQIASQLGVPAETIRSYGERFALFLPVVRTGAELRYPPEGVALLAEIDQAVQAGVTFEEITLALQDHVPSMVVAARESSPGDLPSTPPSEDFVRLLNEQRGAIAEQIAGLGAAIDRLATADQFHGLRAETASLAAALGLRDSQLEHANGMIVAELGEALASLREEVAQLRAELRDARARSGEAAATVAPEAPPAEPKSDRSAVRQVTTPERRNNSRTPRRMGQPLKLNGVVRN